MVILSSPSGAGKTTLVKLLSKNKNFHISVSHTTRKPRLNEIANKDYYFVNHDKFEKLIKNEEFLEYAKVFNHLYGTTRTPVIEKLEKSENVIFDIDWQGADQIKNKKLNYKLITFFILPPSKGVLFRIPLAMSGSRILYVIFALALALLVVVVPLKTHMSGITFF